jgi:hypothetical protein
MPAKHTDTKLSEQAGAFIAEARAAILQQKSKGGSLYGTSSAAATEAISALAESAHHLPFSLDVKKYILQRFEELSTSVQHPAPDKLRPYILVQLVQELGENTSIRDVASNPEYVMACTLYHGAIGPKLCAEFPELSRSKNVIAEAMRNHPLDPRSAIESAKQKGLTPAKQKRFSTYPKDEDAFSTTSATPAKTLSSPEKPQPACGRNY